MIFLIGGGGFVGSSFARVLGRSGRDFAIIEKDNYPDFVGKACDVIINANGNSRKPLAATAPLEEFQLSVTTVRASLADFACKLYVHLSTCDVYPDCSSPEVTAERQVIDVSRQSPYGFHKYLAEQCVRHAAPDWLIIRMGGLVGPGLKKNAIFDILHGGPLWLDAESELQFMHSETLAELVLALVDRQVRSEVYNVCGQGVVRLREVIEWAGTGVAVTPGSPKVRYEVNIEKLSRLVAVPPTRETVRAFVRAESPRALAETSPIRP